MQWQHRSDFITVFWFKPDVLTALSFTIVLFWCVAIRIEKGIISEFLVIAELTLNETAAGQYWQQLSTVEADVYLASQNNGHFLISSIFYL